MVPGERGLHGDPELGDPREDNGVPGLRGDAAALLPGLPGDPVARLGNFVGVLIRPH